MKVNLFAVLLLLITNSLIAQNGFSLKLTQDETGLFTVTAKASANIIRPVLGTGQITVIVPKGGLIVSDLVNLTGEWKHNLVNTDDYRLDDDYTSFFIQPGESFFLGAIAAEEELKLFSFRNSASCIGPIRLIDANFTPSATLPLNLGMDIGMIDLVTDIIHPFIGHYESTEISCQSEVDATIFLPTMVKWINNHSAIITWQPIPGILNFQLEVRVKGDTEWDSAKTIKLSTPTAYFYGVPNQLYEYRLITNYEDGTEDISAAYELINSIATNGE